MMTQQHSLLGPKPGTTGSKIVRALYEHGSLSIEEGTVIHGRFGSTMPKHIAVLDKAVTAGWIEFNAGRYQLTPSMRALMDDQQIEAPAEKPALTASPYRPDWKPLSMKHVPSTQARRHDAGPVREISFITISSDVPFNYGY